MNVNDVPGVLNGWNDVEKEISTLARARAEQARINALYKAQIAELKAKQDQELNQVEFQVKQSESNITGFVKAHLADFKVKRNKEFITGKISVKVNKGYDYPDDEDLVELLHELKLESLIEVEETPCKSAIRNAAKSDPELFEKLGIELKDETSVKIETY